ARYNAHSRQWNWNLNTIHTYTPATGTFKATTSAGVQVEDRELGRARVVAHGLLPGQSNIDQGSVLQQQFELNLKERTLAFYGQEEFLTLAERDRKSTRLNSSHEWISYAVFCLKKKKIN